MNSIIEVKNMSFSYDGKNNILNNVNLNIDSCSAVCVIGPNGGGKSTLLKIMLGLLEPSSGSVKIMGLPPKDARRMIGYMPQYHQLDSSFPITSIEVVLMGRLRPNLFGRYSKKDKEIAQNALDELGIGEYASHSFAELSGGQRQRVLIARALAGDPKILLLDEPTANIDPGAEEQFYSTLSQLKKRMTVITVSHDMGFVNKENDLVACVNRKVSIHNAVDFTAEVADEVYQHPMHLINHDHSCFCGCCNKNKEEK